MVECCEIVGRVMCIQLLLVLVLLLAFVSPFSSSREFSGFTPQHGDPLMGKLLLKKVLRGILRYQGQRHILRQPVTPGTLLAIRPILEAWLGEGDFSMVWAAFTLAFYGFLRCSEFTYPGVHRFRPQFDLGTDCVSFYPSLVCPQHIVVTLKSSKTDFSRRGQSVVIAKAPGTVCAVSAMQQFFLTTRPSRGPLFSFRSGRLLTRSAVICLLRDAARCAGLPYHSLKGHSFRIGAASTAAAEGLPDWLLDWFIKVLGRWSLAVTSNISEHRNRSCCPRLHAWLASQARIRSLKY